MNGKASHLETCPACRDALRALHDEPLPEAAYAAVRARVLADLSQRRPAARLWPWAAAIACAVVLLLMLARVPKPMPVPLVAMAPRIAQPVAPSPPPHRLRASVRPAKRASRRRPPAQPAQPAAMLKLVTSDPDVVIYWIFDKKGD